MTRIDEAGHLTRLRTFGGEPVTADLTTTSLTINYANDDQLQFDGLRSGVIGEASRVAATVMAEALGITNEKDVLALIYMASYSTRIRLRVRDEDRQITVIAHTIFDR